MYKRIKLVRKLIHLQLTHAGHNKRYINYIYIWGVVMINIHYGQISNKKVELPWSLSHNSDVVMNEERFYCIIRDYLC